MGAAHGITALRGAPTLTVSPVRVLFYFPPEPWPPQLVPVHVLMPLPTATPSPPPTVPWGQCRGWLGDFAFPPLPPGALQPVPPAMVFLHCCGLASGCWRQEQQTMSPLPPAPDVL